MRTLGPPIISDDEAKAVTNTIDKGAAALGPSKPVMTIGEAKQIFKAYGDKLEDFYQNVYSQLIADKLRVELSNSNYLHALQLTSLMMRKTERDFAMLSGGTTDGFIEILGKEFRGMLSRLAASKRKAQIIILNATARSELLAKLIREFPTALEVHTGLAVEPERVGHFIVADDMVRIEKPHPSLTDETDANTIEAQVVFNSPRDAEAYRRRFESFLKLVTP